MFSIVNSQYSLTRVQSSILSIWTVIYGGVNCNFSSKSFNLRSYKFINTENTSRAADFMERKRSLTYTNPSALKLEDYDCIGFDLDNTLCEYDLSASVEMEYKVLADFLVNKKGYDPSLLNALDRHSINFFQKGLIVDFARGNLLKIGEGGIICKASHGTTVMREKEIVDSYGIDKKWEVTDAFCKNMLVAWDGPLSEKMRALMDYFDMPASLAFARIVDSLDEQLGRPADIYNVWPDVLDGLRYMYKRENFMDENHDGYFKKLKNNPKQFIKKCDPAVLNWLMRIKESKKKTFLITGSNCDFASLTAEICLGKNWKDLFDVVICYARKPGFFTSCRPFIELDGCTETDPVDESKLELGKVYSQGNWQELYRLFARTLKKKDPKCLYFGDNLLQDIYTPAKFTKCDTIAIVEELAVEDVNKPFFNKAEDFLLSPTWGSYFFDENEQIRTVWGSVINNYSKMCIPNLSFLATYSLDQEFTLYNSHKGGFSPIELPFPKEKAL